MNKSDLAEELSTKSGITVKKAAEIVQLLFEQMNSQLLDGQRIEIRGFGSFVIKQYGAYVGRNPKTKAQINVPPKRLPYFKVGKELRLRIDAPAGNSDGRRGGGADPKSGAEKAAKPARKENKDEVIGDIQPNSDRRAADEHKPSE